MCLLIYVISQKKKCIFYLFLLLSFRLDCSTDAPLIFYQLHNLRDCILIIISIKFLGQRRVTVEDEDEMHKSFAGIDARSFLFFLIVNITKADDAHRTNSFVMISAPNTK